MNKYFFIKDYCEIVNGDKGSLLYDIKNQKMFSFDFLSGKIVNAFEQKQTLKSINDTYGEKNVNSIISELLKQNLGYYSEDSFYQEKFRVGRNTFSFLEITPFLNTCFIELPTDCNKNCYFCNYDKYYACETCTKPKFLKREINEKRYYELLNNVLLLDFKKLVFHGGDPITNWGTLYKLLQYVRQKSQNNITIIVKTNGELLKENIIDFFISYNINPLLVFDCTKNYEIKLSQKLTNINYLLKKMYNNNLLYYANVVVDYNTASNLDNIYQFLKEYNFKHISNSVVIKKNSIPDIVTKLNLNDRAFYNFNFQKQYHPCLNGNIAITSDRKIIPCPSMYENIIIDLDKQDFLSCFEVKDNIQSYWKLSLDKIEVCKKCEYRYSCTDCRSLDEKICHNLYGKKLCERILVK